MKIVLIGAPGSGKGTQASLIAKEFNIAHISTGEIFRENIEQQTALGLQIKEIIDNGNLCPDDLTIKLVENRLTQPDCENGYLLDGFPRNLNQAEALDKFNKPDKVINIDIPLDIIENRIIGRRSCAKCGKSFHVNFIGQAKICPDCGGELIIRKDDNPTSVHERLQVFKLRSEPVRDYYLNKNILFDVDGNCSVDKVFEQIKSVLNNDKN